MTWLASECVADDAINMGCIFVTLPGVWLTRLIFLDTVELVDGDGVEMLDELSLAGAVLTFLTGRTSTFMQAYAKD